jgi:hypothetical protein
LSLLLLVRWSSLLLLLFLLVILLALLLLCLYLSHNQRCNISTIYNVFVFEFIKVNDVRITFLLLYFLCLSQVQNQFYFTFLYRRNLSDLIIVNNVIVFQSIYCAKMHIHSIPCNFFEFFGINFIDKYSFLTFFNNLFTLLLTLLCYFLLCK